MARDLPKGGGSVEASNISLLSNIFLSGGQLRLREEFHTTSAGLLSGHLVLNLTPDGVVAPIHPRAAFPEANITYDPSEPPEHFGSCGRILHRLGRQVRYTAIGQLLTHSAQEDGPEMFLVLPADDKLPDRKDRAISTLGITSRRFRFSENDVVLL